MYPILVYIQGRIWKKSTNLNNIFLSQQNFMYRYRYLISFYFYSTTQYKEESSICMNSFPDFV